MPMIWNLPNLLTVMRLVAAPGIVIMFLYFSRPLADWIALVLFLVAAISDNTITPSFLRALYAGRFSGIFIGMSLSLSIDPEHLRLKR